MNITLRKLQSLGACGSATDCFKENKLDGIELKKLCKKAAKIDRFDWVRWLLTHLMTKEQNQKFAIYCAELILPIYEKKYPNDDRPRKAINAAKLYLKGKISLDELIESRRNAAAAAYAAYAAAADAKIKIKLINYAVKLIEKGVL